MEHVPGQLKKEEGKKTMAFQSYSKTGRLIHSFGDTFGCNFIQYLGGGYIIGKIGYGLPAHEDYLLFKITGGTIKLVKTVNDFGATSLIDLWYGVATDSRCYYYHKWHKVVNTIYQQIECRNKSGYLISTKTYRSVPSFLSDATWGMCYDGRYFYVLRKSAGNYCLTIDNTKDTGKIIRNVSMNPLGYSVIDMCFDGRVFYITYSNDIDFSIWVFVFSRGGKQLYSFQTTASVGGITTDKRTLILT